MWAQHATVLASLHPKLVSILPMSNIMQSCYSHIFCWSK